jgi:hypothetical protein
LVPRIDEAAGSTFTRPADFDAQRYARQAFGITSGARRRSRRRRLVNVPLRLSVACRAVGSELLDAGMWKLIRFSQYLASVLLYLTILLCI